ncbi:unnamed protein product [Rotaria sp. Silwood2]|nr:unnamed protein product [Rotaria sp. Silwood2]CAF3415303.1 unnamed protein product [Rotaria sp. Silwood2]CAF4252516.1 unnamed protein product [Rotaria sp. Silwood2]CAF4443479.1 unnamed protein product [Rotaria sp. Silwood2]
MTDKRYSNDQAHWRSQLSASQVRTPPNISRPLSQQQQPQIVTTKQKKKKSRGDRAEQHFQRRLRLRNLDEETRALLVQARVERQRKQQQQTVLDTAMEVNPMGDQMINMAQDKQMMEIPLNDIIPKSNSKKRKRNTATKIDRHLSQSLSRLSISQGCSKKTKKNVPSNNVLTKMVDELNGQPKISTKNCKSAFVPQYLKVSNRKFKEMLSKAVHDGHKIYEWLDNDEKLKFTRELAHIFNLMDYLKLQQQLWQDYFDIGMNDGVWAPRVSKSKAKEHNTCVSYGRSEKFVEQRQKTIQHQLNHTYRQLQQHLAQLPEWTEKVQPPIDSTFLSNAIQAMVKNGLHRLNAQFKHKQAMLKFDADDHRLIAAVYDLKPTEEQIVLLKIYWQAVADEQKALEEMEVLRKRVSLRRLPQSFDKILDQSIASIQTMLSRPILHKDRRASMASRCSKTITQYKFDLMAMTIAIAQDTARGHAQLTVDTKNKLRLLDGDQVQSSTELLIKAMETRAQNMKKRAQELLQYKLMSFFEQAPAVHNDKGNVSAGAI